MGVARVMKRRLPSFSIARMIASCARAIGKSFTLRLMDRAGPSVLNKEMQHAISFIQNGLRFS